MKPKKMQVLPVNEIAIQIGFTKKQKRLTETERKKSGVQIVSF